MIAVPILRAIHHSLWEKFLGLSLPHSNLVEAALFVTEEP